MFDGITGDRVGCLKPGRVKRVFRTKQIQVSADKRFYLLLPMFSEGRRLGGHTLSLEVADDIDDDPLIVKTSAKGRPAFDLKRHREQGVCRTICPPKVFRRRELRFYLRKVLRHAI